MTRLWRYDGLLTGQGTQLCGFQQRRLLMH
jgi:hypothetical protein